MYDCWTSNSICVVRIVALCGKRISKSKIFGIAIQALNKRNIQFVKEPKIQIVNLIIFLYLKKNI